jgi:hypothetical protein
MGIEGGVVDFRQRDAVGDHRDRTPLARMLPSVIGGPAWDRGRVRMPDRLPRRLGYRELHESKSGLAFRTDRVVSSSPEC